MNFKTGASLQHSCVQNHTTIPWAPTQFFSHSLTTISVKGFNITSGYTSQFLLNWFGDIRNSEVRASIVPFKYYLFLKFYKRGGFYADVLKRWTTAWRDERLDWLSAGVTCHIKKKKVKHYTNRLGLPLKLFRNKVSLTLFYKAHFFRILFHV